MNRKLVAAGVAVALGVGVAATAVAQVKPDVLVKQRQAKMVLQGKYIGPLVGMVKGSVPFNANVATQNAANLDALSKMAWDGFDESTKGEKTRALPVIWTDSAKFKQYQTQLETGTAALLTAAKGGNEGAFKSAVGEVLKACNGCHDDFRQK